MKNYLPFLISLVFVTLIRVATPLQAQNNLVFSSGGFNNSNLPMALDHDVIFVDNLTFDYEAQVLLKGKTIYVEHDVIIKIGAIVHLYGCRIYYKGYSNFNSKYCIKK